MKSFQPEYFGLRYMNKKLQFRWLELDRPLKRQLDKNAHSPLLYFGVMFFVPDAPQIEDDMTRYVLCSIFQPSKPTLYKSVYSYLQKSLLSFSVRLYSLCIFRLVRL